MYHCLENHFIYLAHPGHKCIYERFSKRVEDEGNMLEFHSGKTFEEAKSICDSIPDCWSFGFSPDNGNTYFFDKQLFGNEEEINFFGLFTAYKKCSK